MDLGEFKKGQEVVGLALTDAEAEAAFAEMDKNGGGQVLFDEFCAYIAQSQCPVSASMRVLGHLRLPPSHTTPIEQPRSTMIWSRTL